MLGGADAFVRAVADGLASPPPPDAEPTRALETLRRALALTPPTPAQLRTIVLATSHDDPTALAEREGSLDAADYPTLLPIFPAANDEQERCSEGVERWRLVKWLKKQSLADISACKEQHLNRGHRDSGMRKIPGPVATRDDGTPACRVRVHLRSSAPEVETPCDPKRGWVGPVAAVASASPGQPTVTCEVTALAGD